MKRLEDCGRALTGAIVGVISLTPGRKRCLSETVVVPIRSRTLDTRALQRVTQVTLTLYSPSCNVSLRPAAPVTTEPPGSTPLKVADLFLLLARVKLLLENEREERRRLMRRSHACDQPKCIKHSMTDNNQKWLFNGTECQLVSHPRGVRNRLSWFPCSQRGTDFDGEFDPGSGRTLAACLTHASRTDTCLVAIPCTC